MDTHIAHTNNDIDPNLREQSSLDGLLHKLQRRVSTLGLSVRSENCLSGSNIIFVGDLVQKSPDELMSIQNFGRRCLQEIETLLKKLELGLSMHIQADYLNLDEEVLPPSPFSFGSEQSTPQEEETYFPHQDDLKIPAALRALRFPLDLLKRVELLGLSARASNYLKSNNVTYLGDIVHLSESTLFRSRNLGRKTVQEIKDKLSVYELRLDMNIRSWPPENLQALSAEYDIYLVQQNTEGLKQSFYRTLNKLSDPKHACILRSRIGVDTPPKTLEELGQELGITRERVRQIQKKQTRLILEREFWDDILRIKLRTLLAGRLSPLYLDEISRDDIWFDGFENDLVTLENIISSFCDEEKYFFFDVQGRRIVSRLQKEEWVSIKYELLGMLENTLQCNHSFEDVEMFVASRLSQADAPELSEPFLDELCSDLNFSVVDGETFLVSVGNTLACHLRKVLDESPSPLHFSEIADHYACAFGVEISSRNVHTCLVNNSDFLLFGRGLYGLKKHLGLSEKTQQQIISILENEIAEHDCNRQWHAADLTRIVLPVVPEKEQALVDKYKINIILRSSRVLTYLGKSMWKYKVDGDEAAERLHIKQAVYNALREANEPLHVDKLREMVSLSRGTSDFFSINLSPNELYAKVDPATWGLLERDFILRGSEWRQIKDSFERLLHTEEKAIHKSEILSQLPQELIARGLTEGHVFGVFQADERFKTWNGKYIGLSEWKNSGRKSFQEAMRFVAEQINTPTSTEEILVLVHNALGCDFNKYSISFYLNKYGLSYDKESKLWQRIVCEEDANHTPAENRLSA